MNNKMLSYSAPEFMVYEVAAERGYQASVEGPGFGLPSFGTDTDELI